MPEDKRTFRSAAWFGRDDKDGIIHRGWMRNQGLPSHVFDGRPVIGICNTWSELTPCNAYLRTLADQVKRGVWEAGGLPLAVSGYVDRGNKSLSNRDAVSQFGQHRCGRKQGADLDFLVGCRGTTVTRESH